MTGCPKCGRAAKLMSCALCGEPMCATCLADPAHVALHTPDRDPIGVDAAQKAIDSAMTIGPARMRTIREALAAAELACSLLRAVVRSAPGGGL